MRSLVIFAGIGFLQSCCRGFSFPSTPLQSPKSFTWRLLSSNEDDSVHQPPIEDSLSQTEQRSLNHEFTRIAVPALIQLTAEPLAGLVDTAYLGRLGASVLGGAGVAISAQYAIAKLYNDPLLRTSISLVATTANETERSEAVSSALFLAATIGVVQMMVYIFLGDRMLSGMGVGNSNSMYASALGYLNVRAYGTPAATLWLVTNGIFRGLGDTQTPLIYSLLFTALNALLDPFFIFVLGWGAAGAAAGTTVAQYIALLPLLIALNRKCRVQLSSLSDIQDSLRQYVSAGMQVFVRTVAKVWCYSICARQAALSGAVAAAAYNLTFQLGFAVTQICESIAIAVQTLLAREMGQQPQNPGRIRHLIQSSVRSGGIIAISLSLATFFRRDSILKSLTTDVGIQNAAAGIFPVVLLTQVAKGFCYPVNGILMGGLDWSYTMGVMWMANVACLGVLFLPKTAMAISLERIWWGLCAFMSTQVVFGVARYQSRTGPWKVLRRAKRQFS